MLCFPNAKINLGLFVTEKRSDGFHNIESIFLPTPFCDVLEIIPRDQSGIDLQLLGKNIPGPSADNLIVRAYQLFHQRTACGGVHATLLKHIPTGAGLGGGSANAAFMLSALNDLFETNIDIQTLEQWAAELGSDCPFFIQNKPAFVTGRGEHLQPLDWKPSASHIALIHPGIHISTPWAFQQITPRPAPIDLREAIQSPMSSWQRSIANDFEPAAIRAHPEIGEIKNMLMDAGATFAAMSGSGSTVFGLFDSTPVLPQAKPHWTVFTDAL
ncbi:MAG: 4-(cytidine 5'-diphospho)-2-C-methyl-D-erythritol kinase [Flavobacteriales bacterium]